MEFNLIKIFDEKTANELVECGFSYAIEQRNKQKIYVFEATEELLTLLQSQYDSKQFICENKLCF